MATKAVLTALALCLCIQFSLADKNVWLTNEESEALSRMCPNKTGYSQAPMPPDSCEIESYLGCQNGKAKQKIECPANKFYNRTTGWCEPAVNVTRPPGCPDGPIRKPKATSCKEVTTVPDTLPVEYTCKFYISCDQTGSYTMPCPYNFYYYDEKKQCISLALPYSVEMPSDFIQRCDELDPYTN